MAAEAAGCNLCPVFMAQSLAMLSDGVGKNAGLLVTFKLVSEASDRLSASMITDMLARDSRLDHHEVKRFAARLPIGWENRSEDEGPRPSRDRAYTSQVLLIQDSIHSLIKK